MGHTCPILPQPFLGSPKESQIHGMSYNNPIYAWNTGDVPVLSGVWEPQNTIKYPGILRRSRDCPKYGSPGIPSQDCSRYGSPAMPEYEYPGILGMFQDCPRYGSPGITEY